MNSNQTSNCNSSEINVFSIIKALVPAFPDTEIEHLINFLTYREIHRNEYFIKADQVPKKIGFLCKGIARYVYPDNDGNEFVKGFLFDGSILSSYTAMKGGTPSYYAIQALTTLSLFELSYSDWIKISASNAVWKDFLIAMLEMGYAVKVKRERELLLFDAESRYKIFKKEFGDYESTLKQHHIASYLGITPVALSRIRRKMNS